MEILLSFSILSFGIFSIPVGCDQPVTPSMPLSMIICTKRFEKLYSEIHNSSTISEKAEYSTKENKAARIKEHYDVFDPWKACVKLNGQCKNQCGENEFKMSYCARPETLCCLTECDPVE